MTPQFALAATGEIVAHRADREGLDAWPVLTPQHARDLLADLSAYALAYERTGDPRTQSTARNAVCLAEVIRAQEERRAAYANPMEIGNV